MSIFDPNSAAGRQYQQTLGSVRRTDANIEQRRANAAAVASTPEFRKWAHKRYGGDMDYNAYVESLRKGNAFIPLANQFSRDPKGLYPSNEYDPTNHSEFENQAWHDYLKDNGFVKAFDENAYNKYYVRARYSKDYTNTNEDKAAYEAGQLPMKQQMFYGVQGEIADFRKKAAGLFERGAGAQEYRNLFNSYKWLAGLSQYAKEKALKAAEDARKAVDNLTYDFSGIEGSHGKDRQSHFDEELMKRLGYDPANGFEWLLDQMLRYEGAERAGNAMDRKIADREHNVGVATPEQYTPPQPRTIAPAPGPGPRSITPAQALAPGRFIQGRAFEQQVREAGPGALGTIDPLQPAILDTIDEMSTRRGYTGVPSNEDFVKAIETGDKETAKRWADYYNFASGGGNSPRLDVPRFTPEQAQRLELARVGWDRLSDDEKKAVAFALKAVAAYSGAGLSLKVNQAARSGDPEDRRLAALYQAVNAQADRMPGIIPELLHRFGQTVDPADMPLGLGYAGNAGQLGSLAGFAAQAATPGGALQGLEKAGVNLVAAVAPKLVGTLGENFVRGALSFGSWEAINAVAEGKDAHDVAKTFLLNAAMGGFGDAGFRMLGEYFKGAIPKAGTPAFKKMLESGDLIRKLETPAQKLGKTLAQIVDESMAGGKQPARIKRPVLAKAPLRSSIIPAQSIPRPGITPAQPTGAPTIAGNAGGANVPPQGQITPAQQPTLPTGQNMPMAAGNAGGGITNMQNPPPAGGANPSAGPSQAFETSRPRLSPADYINRFIRDTIDPQQGLKRIGDGQAAYRGAINSKNVGTQIANILERDLTGLNGRPVLDAAGKPLGSLKKVLLENVPRGQELDFWEYALQKHNIARANEGKPIFSQTVNGKEVYFSAAESAARVAQLDALHPGWSAQAKNITNWLDAFMKEWGIKAGTVEAQAYKDLRLIYDNYLPTNRAFSDLEDFLPGGGAGSGFIDKSAPIMKATGSVRNIIDPTENIINLVNRTVRTARLNRVGQLLVDAIRANPAGMRPLAEIVPHGVANVDNVMQVLVGGKPVHVKINDVGVMDTLTKLCEVKDVGKFAKAVGKVTGFMKSAITTNNPIFGVLNGFRDAQTYLAMTQANPVRAIKNYVRAGAEVVAADIINPVARKLVGKEIQTPMLDQFRGLGGEGSTLTGGRTFKAAEQLTGRKAITNAKGEITRFRDVAAPVRLARWLGSEAQKFNTAIEITPRYAEFLNALKKGKTLEEALYDAAEITTNFSRGGKYLKEGDHFVLYLNASVQGLARLARSLNPLAPRQFIRTLIGGGIAITLPQAILTEINKNNPYYKEMDNRIKDAFFLIPNTNDVDASGTPRSFYRIPRSRELGYIFGAFYDRVYRAASGDPNAWKGFGDSGATTFLPADPLKNNLISPLVNVAANRDVFGRSIVPQSMAARSPHLQFDDRTTEPAKWLMQALHDVSGGMLDFSPKAADYLADAYLGIISDIGMPAMTRGGDVGNVLGRRFTADPMYSSQTITDFYDELDRLNALAADRNFKENIDSNASTPEERRRSVLNKAAQQLSDLSKGLTNAPDPRAVREQMIQVARDALAAVKGAGGGQTIYPAGVDDQKRGAYDKIVAGGISETKMKDIFARFQQLTPRAGNKTVTTKDRKDMLWAMVGRGELTKDQYRLFVSTYYPVD